ncbi:aspartate/glutamate racemase family protein [Nonomuraea sp. K274]|uniref:Aspartate/glutamate racemase family protein n=1 Tax=Nonomuraea cypriaca TaxID=1187855 RepID=A0A931EWF8_9ACTN|nr:aspartate/glutamate racemase family protein [Nonomuraea cypriaca]MBF8184417.1 aspartate/glutamate racemase family protein [Nonomuraea cypriaca]
MAEDTRTLRGGLPFYGFDVGILLLNNDTPRPVGDIGHAATWGFPVLYEVVAPAAPDLVVERAAEGLLPDFMAGARRLERAGVRAITTACGFLAIYQQELAEAVNVPVATSSLLQIPQALRLISPGRRVCVLTINASTLDHRHFAGAGVGPELLDRITVVGLEKSRHLYPALIQGARMLDVAAAEREMVDAATRAVEEDESIGAFVVECTNMPPYSAAVRAATGRPVWDVVTLVHSLHSAVVRS